MNQAGDTGAQPELQPNLDDGQQKAQAALIAVQPEAVSDPAGLEAKSETVQAEAKSEPVEPSIDPAIQAWVRRELDLAGSGLTADERKAANP